MLPSLADMLESNNRFVRSFISFRSLMNHNEIPTEVKLDIHAHAKTQRRHEQK